MQKSRQNKQANETGLQTKINRSFLCFSHFYVRFLLSAGAPNECMQLSWRDVQQRQPRDSAASAILWFVGAIAVLVDGAQKPLGFVASQKPTGGHIAGRVGLAWFVILVKRPSRDPCQRNVYNFVFLTICMVLLSPCLSVYLSIHRSLWSLFSPLTFAVSFSECCLFLLSLRSLALSLSLRHVHCGTPCESVCGVCVRVHA